MNFRPRPTAALLIEATCSVGEGPLWDGIRGWLWWVDALIGDVHFASLDTKLRGRWSIGGSTGQSVASLVLHESGLIGLGMREGFGVLDPTRGSVQVVTPVKAGPAESRLNDGKCDGLGRWWAGTMTDPPTKGTGSLFCLTAAGQAEAMLDGLTISNGIGWSPDYREMYLIDSATGCLDRIAFDLSTGQLGQRITMVEVPPAQGSLDGLAVDEDGCIWVAVWGAGQVRCFDPSGQQVCTVDLPVSAVSSCAFGGSDLSTLFVTSARYQEPPERLEQQPLAGSVFAVDVGVRGMPVEPWRAELDVAAAFA